MGVVSNKMRLIPLLLRMDPPLITLNDLMRLARHLAVPALPGY